jgi:DNA-binding PucR family transcriptional regulator
MGVLENTAAALADLSGAPRYLSIVASASTLWLWLPIGTEPELARLELVVPETSDVRIAMGSRGVGIEGFRRSHLDALTAQRMLARLESKARRVSFDRVRLVSLVTADREGAEHFIRGTLGELASADADLRATVEIFLDEGCNASRAADRLSVHRNTLLRRLAAADTLLPRPLQDNRVHVGVALEVLRWLAPPAR